MNSLDLPSFAAFVMTFNRPHILSETLRTILEQSHAPERILVVDNGDAAQTVALVPELRLPNVDHHVTGDNLGPAAAAGIGLDAIARLGYDWIYWVDDDDPPRTPDTLERLLRLAHTAGAAGDVAAVAAVGQRFDWKSGVVDRLTDQELVGPVEIDVAGGNGQLVVAAHAVQSAGLPDTRLFIDFEDTAYCLRLRRAGYRLLVDGDLMREYRTQTGRIGYRKPGAPSMNAAIGNMWRRYYVTRNYIFCMRTAFGRPDLARREAVRALGRSLYAWTHGPRYGYAYSRMALRGVRDGYTGRMGRTVLPQPKYDHAA